MEVYADILMLVNCLVDYFLILLTSKFLNINLKLTRLIMASVLGGIFSLFIFLPQTNFYLQTLVHILLCAILSFIAFGAKCTKHFVRNTATLFCVNFAYSGAMIALWLIFKPSGMVINNSVIYFDISPMFLILFSLIGYFVVMLIRRFIKLPFLQNTYCEVTLFCLDKKLILSGIVDTGNSLKDVFGTSQIFITEQNVVDDLLETEKQNDARFRKIPCSTITGESLLNGYRIDCAKIMFNNKEYEFKNPILAISQTALNDVKIIVNPENLN